MEKSKYKDYQIRRLLGSPFGRLWKKGIGCIVISVTEPYFKDIYDLIKTHKKGQSKWSNKCERDYNKLISEWERNCLSLKIGDSLKTKHGIGPIVSITREWIIQNIGNHEFIISTTGDAFEHFVEKRRVKDNVDKRRAKNKVDKENSENSEQIEDIEEQLV